MLYRVTIVSVLVLHPLHSLLDHTRPVFSRSKIFISFLHTRPAGDVTRVSVMPRKVTVKIVGVGDTEKKIDEKGQKFLFV